MMPRPRLELCRLIVVASLAAVLLAALPCRAAEHAAPAGKPVNLALVAKASTSFVSGHETLAAVNNGHTPAHSDDKSHGAYGNWPQSGVQWVQYDWTRPISTGKIEVYWFDDARGVRLPKACRLKYWDGAAWAEVKNARGLGLEKNRFNATTFDTISTAKLRIELVSDGTFSTGILQWRVIDSGASPNFPPTVTAGPNRAVVLSDVTHLAGQVRDDGKVRPTPALRWTCAAGPAAVEFADAAKAETTAKFAQPGAYTLKLTANDGELEASDTLRVEVVPPPPATHLAAVPTTPYRVGGPLWRNRIKSLIVHWIPHCIRKIDDPHSREGGIGNFVEAARKLSGATDAKHVGAPFANAWVYNTVESICLALMIDPQGDAETLAAQASLRKTLADWIPKLLSAQEPDGYLHTQYTIQGHRRWSNRDDHEGYQAGYFIEAALAHHTLTGGKDTRLYDAAVRLADCWVRNIGPAPKRKWYDGHQELELALVRLARFVEAKDGPGKGRKYVDLARFLLECRRGGDSYDQSHAPVTRQYEAVGHAVRAVYSYTGMIDVAMETGDIPLHSAVRSIWSNLIHRKYYITGGVGSGETSEGFGKDYSLPNHAYCESCAGCGELFFQHRMQMVYREAKYADLYEESLYNAILGSMDLDGQNFTYTNALDSSERRYKWHVCPCCVGNIPRTLLQLPTWQYTLGDGGVYVNLLAATDVSLGDVAGTKLRIAQTTDYPWRGTATIAVHPERPATFALRIRVPRHDASRAYTAQPMPAGSAHLTVNDQPVQVETAHGYAVLTRQWKPGDRIGVALSLPIQRVKADPRIAADVDRVALRRGPIVYNIESVDQPVDKVLRPDAVLKHQWRPDLLGGVVTLSGQFADGTPFVAVPNYARLNRGGRSVVWIKDR